MITQITLTSFIKQECANYSGDICLGIDVFGKRFRNEDMCWIIKDRKICEYFERCVLGYAKYIGGFDKIFKEYQDINLSITKKESRVCECGKELLKRERFCMKCKKKRRLEAKKKNWHNQQVLD